MAYIQKITPPPNKVLTFSLKNFNGGLNNRSNQLEDNEASDLINMVFSDSTLLEKRPGQKYFDETNFTKPVIFIDEFKPHTDENVLIRATDEFLYIEENVLTDLQGKPQGVNHSGMYIFTDGKTLYAYGKFAQATSTYRKIIGEPIDDYVLLEVVSPVDGHARLGEEHVEGVLNIDYDNFKVFYEPCELEFKDNFKGANKVPEKVSFVLSHNGRLFLSGAEKDDDNVFISDVQNPFYFPVSLPIQLPPNSDEIVGMALYDNSVVVGRRNDVYAIFGNTNRPDMGTDVFQLRRINTHTGFANQDGVCVAHNYLFFLGSDGNAYALGSTRVDEKQLSTSILSHQIDIEKAPINLTLEDIKSAVSVFYQDNWYLSIKDKVLIYSYRHRAWTLLNQINARSMYVLNNSLIWGREDGRTATIDNDNYLDFGVPYECFWYSKHFDMEDANSFKQFREFFVVAHTFNDFNSDINVVFEIDYAEVKDRVVIQNQISVWGKSKWGDRLVNNNINDSTPFIIGRRGRNIRIRISNGYFVHGEVATYADLEYYIGRKEGVLVRVLDEDAYYLYTNGGWKLMNEDDLNQRMKFYQINGEYELRGKR